MAPSTPFKGALRSKRKNDLLEMAKALGLGVNDTASKDDVEEILKTHLQANRTSLAADPNWQGIYTSLDNSEKRAARGSSNALSPDSDASDESPGSARSPRKHSNKKPTPNGVGTPLRQVSNGASGFASSLSARTKRSFESLADAFKTGATDASNEVADVANEVSTAQHALTRRVRSTTRQLEQRVGKAFDRARAYLSNAANITTLILILEALTLVLSVMPTTYYEFGNRSVKEFVKSGGKSTQVPHWAITLPNFWSLLTFTFWRPIVLWTIWTLAIPTAAANLITFDRRHEPSTLTFAIVRLALLSFLTSTSLASSRAVPQVLGVAAGEVRQAAASTFSGSLANYLRALTSYDFVIPFVPFELQILGTSLMAAFATYEVISGRPRASNRA